MLTANKNRWALTLLENAKTFIEKTYPKDSRLIGLIRDAILIVCLKIQKEEKYEDNFESSRH